MARRRGPAQTTQTPPLAAIRQILFDRPVVYTYISSIPHVDELVQALLLHIHRSSEITLTCCLCVGRRVGLGFGTES